MSTVPVGRKIIWDIITDPGQLADLTPMIRSIDRRDSVWVWHLHGIEALGVRLEAVFTERMTFVEQEQIVFTHDPPAGTRERAAVEGVYDLTATTATETRLKVDLTLKVELPLPRLCAGPQPDPRSGRSVNNRTTVGGVLRL